MTRPYYRRGGGSFSRIAAHCVSMKTPTERFWSNVASPDCSAVKLKSAYSDCLSASEACWLWTGATDSRGYGRFIVEGKELRVHRFAYKLSHGTIPPKLHVLSSCGSRLCVRPDHLFLGKAPIRPAKGEESPNAKLTEVEVRGLRLEAEAGMTIAALAAKYHVYAAVQK